MLNQGVFMLRDSSLYSGLREGLEGMDDKPAAPKPAAPKPAAPKTADKKPDPPKPDVPKPAVKAPEKKGGFTNRLSPASF